MYILLVLYEASEEKPALANISPAKPNSHVPTSETLSDLFQRQNLTEQHVLQGSIFAT